MNLKYIVYWSMIPEHREKVQELARSKLPELQKTDGFPMPLTDNYAFPGRREGSRLYEVTKPEEIAN